MVMTWLPVLCRRPHNPKLIESSALLFEADKGQPSRSRASTAASAATVVWTQELLLTCEHSSVNQLWVQYAKLSAA